MRSALLLLLALVAIAAPARAFLPSIDPVTMQALSCQVELREYDELVLVLQSVEQDIFQETQRQINLGINPVVIPQVLLDQRAEAQQQVKDQEQKLKDLNCGIWLDDNGDFIFDAK